MTHFTPPPPKVGMQRTWKSERWWHTQSSLGQLGPSVQKVTRTNVWALLFWSCLTGAEDQHSSASEGTPCYSELPLFLSTRESLGQGKVTLEGWEKAEAGLGPSNSWNQEQLLYGCPLAAACLCLLTHPPCADQLSPDCISYVFMRGALASIMGGLPPPPGYFAGASRGVVLVWLQPLPLEPWWWCVLEGRESIARRRWYWGQCRVTPWPCHLWGLLWCHPPIWFV